MKNLKKGVAKVVVTKKSASKIKSKTTRMTNNAFLPIDFEEIRKRAEKFADHIESNFEELAEILLTYESFEVVQDEVSRALDVLRSLNENKKYFVLRIGDVTSFLPRNQPLYALTCFVIIPSLMANEVYFRIPQSMRHFLPDLLSRLRVLDFFPNINVSQKERLSFLTERSSLNIDPKTEESMPVTDVVIFTGTSLHAEKLRLIFDQRTLFIANGSGHNPVIVSEDANIEDAVEATLTLQLYNQGQDCAAPNTILVHKDIYKSFLRVLRQNLKQVRVGAYRDRSCRVGPISEVEDLKRIQNLLVDNHVWLDSGAPGIIRTCEVIVEPTIILKPLCDGGNYSEVFSPIIFVQVYNHDSELENYFENPHYARNAMYISVYGTSPYVESLIGKEFQGKILHDKASILHNIHLHVPGQERGTKPYGGYGYAASSTSINGKITPKPTLPQRDIYECLIKPLLTSNNVEKRRELNKRAKKSVYKDVRKLLGLKIVDAEESSVKIVTSKSYIDALDIIASDSQRYIEFSPEKSFSLLNDRNASHIAILEPKHIHQIRTLRKFLETTKKIDIGEFHTFLYSIPKKKDVDDKENKKEQLDFFRNIYQLLLGQSSGPRLTQFLLDADKAKIISLLDI